MTNADPARTACAHFRQCAHPASQRVEQRFGQYFDDYGDDATNTARLAIGLPSEGAIE